MKAIISICVLLTIAAFAQAKEWRGITPLKSTRADVERLLGQPVGTCRCIYDTGKEMVSVWYSGEPCADNIPYSYNVPHDTVWEISVRPKSNLSLANLQLESTKLRKAGDSDRPFVVYYLNDEEGMIIEAEACNNRVINVFYLPTPKSDVPGCTIGNGIFDPSPPQKFDEYLGISFAAEKEHLNGLAKMLQEWQWTNGYIVDYSGKRERADAARLRGERAKQYLVNQRGIDAMRIVTIFGGYRDKPSVEVFLWPDRWREYFGEAGKVNCNPKMEGRK